MEKVSHTVLRFIDEQSLVMTADRVLIACSGGVDSVALFIFWLPHRREMGIEVAAVHVDHMLRGEESAEDGVHVKEICERLDIPFYGRNVPVPEMIERDGGNVQAVCRAGRYALFAELMRNESYNVLATGHHAEDQLETVLMQVAKGRRPIGMPVKREVDGGILVRPFFPVTKDELYSYCAGHGLRYREDPSNESDAYMRNRFRHHLLPLILDENPSAAQNIVETTGWLQEDDTLLGMLAVEQYESSVTFTEEGVASIESDRFSRMHPALQRRVITLVLKYLYDGESLPVEYNSTLVGQLLVHAEKASGNVSISLPRGYQFIREYAKLTFVRESERQEMVKRKRLPKQVWTDIGNGLSFYWTEVDNFKGLSAMDAEEVLYVNLPDSAFPLYVRGREDGDRILLPGMNHPKRLSRLLIDEKVPMSERDRLPVIVTAQDEVCAIPGMRYGAAFSRNRTERSNYIVSLRKF